MNKKVRARDRYEDGAKWVDLVPADESICDHSETICDNCVHLGWSNDWEIQIQEWKVYPQRGLVAEWTPVQYLDYPDPRVNPLDRSALRLVERYQPHTVRSGTNPTRKVSFVSYYEDPDAFPDWWDGCTRPDCAANDWWNEFQGIYLNDKNLYVGDQPDDFARYENYVYEEATIIPTYSGGTTPRRPLISGDEQDVIEARQMYCFTQRAGVTARIKRAIRRRERHNWRKELEL